MDAHLLVRWFGDADAFERASGLWGPVSRVTAGVAAPSVGESVFDACCGSGAFALPAARAVGLAGRVVAQDLSPALVARLRVSAQREGLDQLEAVVGDVTDVREPGVFDLVTCVLGVFFLPDPIVDGRRLSTWARPGGRVVVTTWAEGALRQLMPVLGQEVSRVRPVKHGPGRGHADPSAPMRTPEGVRAYLSDLGLVDVEAVRVPLEVSLDVDLALGLLEGSAARGLIDGMPQQDVALVREGLAARVPLLGGVLDASVVIGRGVRPAP